MKFLSFEIGKFKILFIDNNSERKILVKKEKKEGKENLKIKNLETFFVTFINNVIERTKNEEVYKQNGRKSSLCGRI